jgi:small-conductance mechanosensitive channel
MKRFALLAIVLWILTAGARAARPVTSAGSALGSQQALERATDERAPLVVWNRPVAEFRAHYDDWGPSERARRAAARILAVSPEQGKWDVTRQHAQVGAYTGFVFSINGEFVFRLLEGDVDTEDGLTLEQAAAAAEARLREVMDSRSRQRRWPLLMRGIVITIALTLALAVCLAGARWLQRTVQARLVPALARARTRVTLGGINLWPILGGLRLVLARLLTWSIAGGFVYLWLALVLRQFPYTEPWGDALGGFVLAVLARVGWGILASLPDLFVAAVIFALAHAFVRGLGSYFLAVEREQVSVPWLAGETARATRQLLTILVWAFAIVLAYPHIPGSGTDAFKGMGVFIGLMVSLGSAGLVNQIMSGLTVIYSHAYHRGDFVKIGDHEGRVAVVGLLATKIAKPSGEVVSVPNAVVTANTTTNFSPGGRAAPELLATTVTIGYDAPWRQVHALLQLAAQRTPELAPEPPPLVLQRALSDFYVEYQLVAHLLRREQRTAAQSRLHAEIQDAFNEHGVQIMSPHFERQPAETVTVPRTAWFTAPAAREQA